MIMDNYIESAIAFLSIFNTKFSTNNVGALSSILSNNDGLDVYDMHNNKVGALVVSFNDEYKIDMNINGSKIEVKSYRNTKEPLKFEFKYTILRKDRYYKMSGFFSYETKNNKTYLNNEFKTYEDGSYRLYVYFRPNEKRYGLVERNHGREIRMDKNDFKFFANNYKFKLENAKKGIYYQLEAKEKQETIYEELPNNYYGGLDHKIKKEDIPGFIISIMRNELDDYYGFINETKEHLNIYSDNILDNTLDTCLSDDNKPKIKLFKDNRKKDD